jgi:hypothetical protein
MECSRADLNVYFIQSTSSWLRWKIEWRGLQLRVALPLRRYFGSWFKTSNCWDSMSIYPFKYSLKCDSDQLFVPRSGIVFVSTCFLCLSASLSRLVRVILKHLPKTEGSNNEPVTHFYSLPLIFWWIKSGRTCCMLLRSELLAGHSLSLTYQLSLSQNSANIRAPSMSKSVWLLRCPLMQQCDGQLL